MSKPREFWITIHKNQFDVPVPFHAFHSKEKAFKERCHEHVLAIERFAYQKAVDALKWYAQGAPVIGYDRGEKATDVLKELGEL